MTDKLTCFQKSYKKDKLKHLLKTHELADCVFICEHVRVPAHKFILACCSPVFELMLYGQMSSSEIDLPDIDPEDFKQMLEYIYTDQVVIKSVSSAWGLMYISHKYFLTGLLQICVEYITINLCVSNLLLCYEYAQLYNQKELVKICWKDILLYGRGILFSNDYHMKEATLTAILKECDINVSDSDKVLIAVNWATDECVLMDIDTSYENIWNVLFKCNVVAYLNFKDFEQYDVKQIRSTNNSYKRLECLGQIAKRLYCTYGKSICYKNRQMHMPKSYLYQFRYSYKISRNCIFTDSFKTYNVISPSRSIYLFGVVVSTLHRTQTSKNDIYIGSVEVKIQSYDNSFCCKHKLTNKPLLYDDKQFVHFPLPILLVQDGMYQIIVTYQSELECSRGEVLMYYLDQRINKFNTVINFSEELDGSVVQALSFYPA